MFTLSLEHNDGTLATPTPHHLVQQIKSRNLEFSLALFDMLARERASVPQDAAEPLVYTAKFLLGHPFQCAKMGDMYKYSPDYNDLARLIWTCASVGSTPLGATDPRDFVLSVGWTGLYTRYHKPTK